MDYEKVAGGLVDLGTNIYSARQAEENQRRQLRATERQYKNRYQWMMGDLKKAGLNPILAGNLGGGSMSAAGAASGVGSSNLLSSLASKSSAKAANRIATKQESLLDSEIDKNKQAANLYGMQGYQAQQNAESTSMQNWRVLQQNNLYRKYPWLMHMELSPTGVSTGLGAAKILSDSLKFFKTGKGFKAPVSEVFDGMTKAGKPYTKTINFK